MFLKTITGTVIHLVKPVKNQAHCGVHIYSSDKEYDSFPHELNKKLCGKCKKNYLKTHTEDDLFLEFV